MSKSNIKKITITIQKIDGETNEQGEQAFNLSLHTETHNGDMPKRKDVVWALENAIHVAKQ